jgi:type II secretory pathway pseudopilin PulG
MSEYDEARQAPVERRGSSSRKNRFKELEAMKKRGKRAGFSLVEILIVTVMLAMVVMSLISVFTYGFGLLARTKQVTLATEVAQIEVEQFRNMAFEAITTGSTTTVFTQLDYPFLFRDGGEPFLRNGQETIAVEQGADENIKRLTVSVAWDYRTRTIAGGDPMRKDVVTYITRDGINRK